MTVDQRWALNGLRHHRNAAVLSLVAMQLLNSDAVLGLAGQAIVIKKEGVIFAPDEADRSGKRLEIPLDQIIEEYQHHHGRYIETIEETFKVSRRSLVKESFEVAKAYAKATEQYQLLKREGWFPLVRLIRNAISHDFRFQFGKRDVAGLPMTWHGVTLHGGLQGKEMTADMLPPMMAWEIHRECEMFVTMH